MDPILQRGDLHVLGAVILPALQHQLSQAHPTLSTPLPGVPPLQHISQACLMQVSIKGAHYGFSPSVKDKRGIQELWTLLNAISLL